jgi:hypothetical protein
MNGILQLEQPAPTRKEAIKELKNIRKIKL